MGAGPGGSHRTPLDGTPANRSHLWTGPWLPQLHTALHLHPGVPEGSAVAGWWGG